MKKIIHEMTRMKDESNRLKIIMRQYMGEDLDSLTLQDVSNLEQQIDFSLYKVRLRKVTTQKHDVIVLLIYETTHFSGLDSNTLI
jgi:hypothetical protein